MNSLTNPILFLTLEYPPTYGGVGRMYEQLCRCIPSAVEVWTAKNKSGNHPGGAVRVVEANLLSPGGWPKWRATFTTLRHYLRTHQRTNIIVGQILPLGLPVYVLSWFYNVHYGIFVHGMDLTGPLKIARRRLAVQAILRRAHVVYAANQNIAAIVKTLGVPQHRIVVIYPSPYVLAETTETSRNMIREKFRIPAASVILLSVGRLVARKGQSTLLQIFREILDKNPDTYLIIVGDGPERAHLEEMRKTLATPDHVQIVGSVNDSDLMQYLVAANIFVNATRQLPGGDIEGIGIVNLEASAAGLPIVAMRTGAIPEAVQDDSTGILVEENDVESFKHAVFKLINDPAERKRLGQNGKKYVTDNFQPPMFAKRMIQAFQ